MSKQIVSFSSLSKHDKYYLAKAAFSAHRLSKDPSSKVGAVITDAQGNPVSEGVNGFARGIADTPERWNNRELKYPLVIHAELNALIFAKRDISGCSLFTHPLSPCSGCANIFAQAGIVRVVSPLITDQRLIEAHKLKLAEEIFEEKGIELVLVTDIPKEEIVMHCPATS